MTGFGSFENLVLAGWRFWLDGDRLRYRAPKSGLDAEVLERLRADRARLVEVLQRDPGCLDLAPLSHGQKALWLLQQLEPESVAYNQSMLLRPGPEADVGRWREACRHLLTRHPVLRATFVLRNGEPVQRFCVSPELDWAEIRLSCEPSDLTQTLQRLQAEPFDLERGPVARFRWILSDTGPTLAILIHHIACDGWSFEIMRRELLALSDRAGADGDPAHSLPELRHDYRDFVLWQREMLASTRGEQLWDFWKAVLAGPLAPLELPRDFARSPKPLRCGGTVGSVLDAEAASRLRTLATARGVTLNVLMLAAFLALLHRWTRHTDLLVGVPTAGRGLPEWQGVVGYFVDPVAIRAWLDPDDAFDSFLDRVRGRFLAALEHRDLPFALIVERLGAQRDPERSPLFDVLFNFIGVRDAEPLAEIAAADAKFELTLTLVELDAGIRLSFGFRTDLFEAATIEQLAAGFKPLLAAICDDSSRPLAHLLLSDDAVPAPAIRGRALDSASLPPVHVLIRAVCHRRPDAVALADWPEGDTSRVRALTYRDLASEIDRIAGGLMSAGCVRGTRIGLCCERGSDAIVGLLAVLAAGGAYVPLDPDDPPHLMREMLAQAGVSLLLTQDALAGRLQTLGLPLLIMEDTQASTPERSRSDPGVGPDDLAYVVFTSGSTGRPKGVAVEHRGLTNYVASMTEDLGIQPESSFALVSSLTADLGNTAIFLALTSGGTLYVLPKAMTTEPAGFRDALAQGIDYLKIAPSHLAALGVGGPRALPRKGLILGGESSPSEWVQGLLEEGGCRIFNHYGPTEATIGVLVHEVRRGDRVHGPTLPLSRVAANCAVFLLDPLRQPVPSGFPGEIWIAGPCLARGYVGESPEEASGFAVLPGIGRAYRTGDLARQGPDGGLRILGRVDRQVNLHGHRIELAQIEQALLAHGEVEQALVLPDVDGSQASRLIAWVVASEAGRAALSRDALRGFLAARLPAHLIPSRFNLVDRIVLTPNGKVDARAMRALQQGEMTGERRAAIKDATQLRLCLIFSEVLRVEQVSAQDDFFALGGHSLLAVQLAGRIFEEFGKRLPLAVFFTHRTVEALAMVLRESGDPFECDSILVPIRRGGEGAPIILFPGAGGSILYFEALAVALGGVAPIWGAQGSRGDVASMASRYHEAILHHLGPRPCHLIGHSFGALVAFELARLREASGHPIESLWVLDNPAPRAASAERYRHWSLPDWYAHIARRIARLYDVPLALDRDALEGKTDSEQAELFAGYLVEAGALPRGTPREQLDDFVATYRENVIAGERYARPIAPLRSPIHLVMAFDRDALLAAEEAGVDLVSGWVSCSAHPIRSFEVPGTHITMLLRPHVDHLAERIRTLIAASFESTDMDHEVLSR